MHNYWHFNYELSTVTSTTCMTVSYVISLLWVYGSRTQWYRGTQSSVSIMCTCMCVHDVEKSSKVFQFQANADSCYQQSWDLACIMFGKLYNNTDKASGGNGELTELYSNEGENNRQSLVSELQCMFSKHRTWP